MKAVTAVCFIAAESFVTGSDDASLSLWVISCRRQGPSVRLGLTESRASVLLTLLTQSRSYKLDECYPGNTL